MHYSKIIKCDTNNSVGFSVTIFCSGCGKSPKCPHCHNSDAWLFDFGYKYTQETEDMIIGFLSKPYIKTLSILGGEPTDNLNDGWLLKLVKRAKMEYPNKSIFVWSGYTFENLIKNNLTREFLKYVDMLRDGEYIHELRNLSQRFQGSTNQRCVDVQKSLSEGKVVEYQFE